MATIILACGCASIELADGIEPTRLRRIQQGDHRKDVESVLGAPIQVTKTATGSLVRYRCNLGLPRESLATGRRENAEQPDDALSSEQFLAARNVIFSSMFFGVPEIYAHQAVQAQVGLTLVNYDHEERVKDRRLRCVEPESGSEPLVKIY